MEQKIPLTFQIYHGDTLVREETCTQDLNTPIKIGKLESSHLRIDDEKVSRMHAIIEVTGPQEIHIIDLGSSSGTYVNGQKINKCAIQDGDEILLGSTRIILSVGEPIQAEAPAPAPAMAGFAPPPMPGVMPPPGVPPPPGVMPPGGYAQPAPMPVYEPPPMDPTLDKQDGSRAIEVTALLGDSVVKVRHLDNPGGGKVGILTYVLIALGAISFLVGAVMTIAGQPGLAAILLLAGLGMGVYGLVRFGDERQSVDFTIGANPGTDIHLATPAIPAEAFPLVRSSGTDYSLVYTSQMGGDVTVGADRFPLQDLTSRGRAHQAEYPGSFSFPIPQDTRIKVDIGENTFLINSVAPARRVTSPFLSTVDWSAQVFTGLSFTAHALVLFLVFSVPPDAKALSLDLFNTDNRFVKFLIKPQEQKQDEIPDWLKKKTDDEQGGKGQKHKGEEGKMGSKKSKKKTGLYGLKGPKQNPDPHLAKRLAENAAKNAGVLGLLKQSSGSHIASIFGRDSALGTDAEDALGGLIGDQIGEAYGVGGLGLVGTGRGGGGTGEGTIGLGTLGTIGKGGGGGSGAGYGRGVGRLRGRRARAPHVVAGRAEVRGALDKEIIRRIIRRHINEVKYCYQKELQANPDLYGRIVIQFTISPTGQVVSSVLQQSTMNNQPVETCIAMAVRRWLFPKPKGGGIVMVSYPFVLRSAGAGEE